MGNSNERTTRIDDETMEVMENSCGLTRDTLIIAREATHRMAVDSLQSIEIIQAGKDYRIEIRARR